MPTWLRTVLLPFRLRKIRSRMLAAMILISVPPLFVLGYISYNIAKDTLVNNHVQTNEERLKAASEVADLLFRNMIKAHQLVVSNSEIRQMLLNSSTTDDRQQDAINARTAGLLQTIVHDNLIDTEHIASICLFDSQFRPVCFGQPAGEEYAGASGADKRSGIAETEWYRKSVAAKGKEVFLSYNVLDEANSGSTFSSVKLLLDREHPSRKPLGMTVINIKKSIFAKMVTNSGESGFMVIDPSEVGMRIAYHDYPSGELDPGQYLFSTFRRLQEGGFVISLYSNQTTGWTFMYFIKAKALLRQSDQIGIATAIIAALIALAALFFSILISGTITRPLLQMKKMMVDWAKGTQRTETFDEDEVGAIGQTFQQIAQENKLLTERLLHSRLKEREAELRSLQAQIKPHFLYNTLDSIYWMAVLQNNHDIARMAVALSESFKLSLNKGKETIPVRQELKHIEQYMTIQNIRYRNRFHYIEEVDDALKGMEILKLLLQPLVENAIYHGLEPKIGEGTIRLTGTREAGAIRFSVEDDGIGIDNMELTEQGYGLNNVRERLALYYGPASSLAISSTVNQGTMIRITIPQARRTE